MISIIIPVYNGEKFIARAINSILSQSYKDWELVIVDDHSTDQTSQLINQKYSKDCRIKLIRNKNKGVTMARIAGAKESSFETLFFMDADDTLSPNSLSFLNYCYQQYPSSDVIIGDIIHVNGTSQYREIYGYGDIDTGEELFNWIITNKVGFIWGKLIKKELFLSLPVVPVNLKFCEDFIQMLQICYFSKEIHHCGHATYMYYQTSNSACNKPLHKKEYALRFLLLCDYIDLLCNKLNLSCQNKNRLYAMNLYYSRLYLWINGKWPKKSKMKRNYLEYLNIHDVMSDSILSGKKRILTQWTRICPFFFSMFYVALLKYKYHRIK